MVAAEHLNMSVQEHSRILGRRGVPWAAVPTGVPNPPGGPTGRTHRGAEPAGRPIVLSIDETV
jgi:hypothetical protein